jgi:uncharacterized membrane protein YgcG
MSNTFDVRCPICLMIGTVPKNTPTNKALLCQGCRRGYTLNTEVSSVPNAPGFLGVAIGMLGIPLMTLAFAAATPNLKGPLFLIVMIIYVLITCPLNWSFYRKFLSGFVQLWFSGMLLCIAMVRYQVGSAAGKENFSIMFGLLVIGIIGYCVNFEAFGGGGSGYSSCGGSSGSTCGGCGGGGGGCGGCG